MSTIDKALDSLYLLGNSGSSLRLTDIARELHMPRSSAHRILAPLVRRGLAEREAGRYRLGFGLFALGLGVAHREPLVVAAKPVLEAAAADLGETFFLVIARAGQLIVVEKAEGSGFLRAAPRLGATVPVHATAVGKLYLAHAPELVTPIDELTRFTARTVRGRKALETHVEQVRTQGWASNLEEWQPGLCVVAAPVWVGARLCGAVALAMVAARFDAIGERAAIRRVRHAAEGVALRLEGKST